jgi:hypothetical protein
MTKKEQNNKKKVENNKKNRLEKYIGNDSKAIFLF